MKNRNTAGSVIVVNDAANDLTRCDLLANRDIVMEMVTYNVDIN